MWEESQDGGATWTALADGGDYAGTTTADLEVTNSDVTKLTYRYRVIVSNIAFACDLTTTSVDVGYITPEDYDLDGVFDIVDVDDDNDGILDTVEENGDVNRDTDGDGFGNPGFPGTCLADNCPDTFNPSQVDGDGDGDVVLATYNMIAWYENRDGVGSFGPQQVITAEVGDNCVVYAADLDDDGDPLTLAIRGVTPEGDAADDRASARRLGRGGEPPVHEPDAEGEEGGQEAGAHEAAPDAHEGLRSEERRVGQECRSRGSRYH